MSRLYLCRIGSIVSCGLGKLNSNNILDSFTRALFSSTIIIVIITLSPRRKFIFVHDNVDKIFVFQITISLFIEF